MDSNIENFLLNSQIQTKNSFIYLKQGKKVLINPHFNKARNKVYINPNFAPQQNPNPNRTENKDISNNLECCATEIHINPRAIQKTNNKVHINPNFKSIKKSEPSPKLSKIVVLTNRKLIRKPIENKRRNSVKSKYKIIKSIISNTSSTTIKKKPNHQKIGCSKVYKVDNRIKKKLSFNNSNNLSLVNISGILYKKTRTKLKKKRISSISKTCPQKKQLKKCNIPCPNYKKYGICKGLSNKKCILKHDPDQIALCTRFLQGACIKEKCLLSHKVSSEKMPTCKYFLEGNCSKENCPYIHIKLNSKADVCRNFLEGFCHNGINCDKRHQYLCPDFEKFANCMKQRCPYPHGKMVRPYLINSKVNFSKKSMENVEKVVVEKRYYLENKVEINVEEKKIDHHCVGLSNRPKLGILPQYISL